MRRGVPRTCEHCKHDVNYDEQRAGMICKIKPKEKNGRCVSWEDAGKVVPTMAPEDSTYSEIK